MMHAMGTLYVVGTPIGNLEDITLRALRILKEVNVVYCEDTRMTARLFAHYDIKTPLKRLDAHVEAAKLHEVIDRLRGGENVAYVSDAGTPGVSDPGERLVSAVRSAECYVESVPGPSALTAALSISGLNLSQFVFMGFPPHKKGRQTFLREMLEEARAVVVYESTHRIEKLLLEVLKLDPSRVITLARELTKAFEEVLTGTSEDILAHFKADPNHMRGEFVVIIHPRE